MAMKPVCARAIAIVAAVATMVPMASSCTKTTTSPSGTVTGTPSIGTCTNPTGCGAPPSNVHSVQLNVTANNNGAAIAWSYTAFGLAVSGTGDKATEFVNVSLGDVEVSGVIQERGNFSVGVNPLGSGESQTYVVPGSLQNLEGPANSTGPCFVQYLVPFSATGPQNFKFKFTLTDKGQSCF